MQRFGVVDGHLSKGTSVFELPCWTGTELAANSGSGSNSGGAPRQRAAPQRRGSGLGRMAGDTLVPWSMVEGALAMARDALAAKQRIAEVKRDLLG
jgi:hypothetical protein